jgi:hypothetical protein
MFSNKKYQNGKSFVTFFEDTIRVFKPRPPSIFLYSVIAKNPQFFLYKFKFRKKKFYQPKYDYSFVNCSLVFPKYYKNFKNRNYSLDSLETLPFRKNLFHLFCIYKVFKFNSDFIYVKKKIFGNITKFFYFFNILRWRNISIKSSLKITFNIINLKYSTNLIASF